jgi:hypothetical protein
MHDDYYFIDTQGKYLPLSPRTGKNLQYFGRNSDEMKDYIKQNGLRFSREEDLVQIFRYFDGLI